jgi:hypothetical protein
LFKHDVLLSVEFLIRKSSLLLCGVTKGARGAYSIEKTIFFSALRSFYPHNNILCISILCGAPHNGHIVTIGKKRIGVFFKPPFLVFWFQKHLFKTQITAYFGHRPLIFRPSPWFDPITVVFHLKF